MIRDCSDVCPGLAFRPASTYSLNMNAPAKPIPRPFRVSSLYRSADGRLTVGSRICYATLDEASAAAARIIARGRACYSYRAACITDRRTGDVVSSVQTP